SGVSWRDSRCGVPLVIHSESVGRSATIRAVPGRHDRGRACAACGGERVGYPVTGCTTPHGSIRAHQFGFILICGIRVEPQFDADPGRTSGLVGMVDARVLVLILTYRYFCRAARRPGT